MAPSPRTEQARLQATIGELGDVLPYRWRVLDLNHPEVGWWVAPAIAVEGCSCGLCAAARDGRDVFLGSISRIAHIRAGALVNEHFRVAA